MKALRTLLPRFYRIRTTGMTGDMRALRAACPAGLDFIAFERGFQTDRPAKVYPMAKFQHLIH